MLSCIKIVIFSDAVLHTVPHKIIILSDAVMHKFKFFGAVGQLWEHDKFGNFGIVVLVKLVNFVQGGTPHMHNINIILRLGYVTN